MVIICDASYLKALRQEVKQARQALPSQVAEEIDLEIEKIKAQGGTGPWYSRPTIAKAFNVSHSTVKSRTLLGQVRYQGSLPRYAWWLYGDWFEATTVNKDTYFYRTWPHPNMAKEALDLAHHLERYRAPRKSRDNYAQSFLDKRRIKHGNDRSGHYGTHGVTGTKVQPDHHLPS